MGRSGACARQAPDSICSGSAGYSVPQANGTVAAVVKSAVEIEGVAAPQQGRSRESFARVRAATVQLLSEKGPKGVLIADVSALAGVSVGTIYGRVGSRANLLRVVHREELERMRTSMVARLDALEFSEEVDTSLRQLVHAYVAELVQNVAIIGALQALVSEDPEMASAGPEVFAETRAAVVAALARALGAGASSVDTAWLGWVFEVMFASTRHWQDESAAMPASAGAMEESRFEEQLGRSVILLLR
nr:TetR/AcrR family transcriptional regulator [Microbacterium yannicii]